MVDKSGETLELANCIGRNIAARRKQLSWTQGQLAERVGVDSETISRFERGVHLPSLPTLYKLATTLMIDLGDLVSIPKLAELDDGAIFNTLTRDLTKKDREFILNIVRDYSQHLRNK
jgi:transcriptional regulator with XRE-family HTH domain